MKKLDNKGFTLVELLCTIVIVLLLTACITVGIGTCSKVFGSTFGFSKAQTLSSSLNYQISEELRTAYNASYEDGVLTYQSNNYEHDKVNNMYVDENGYVVVETHNVTDPYNVRGDVYTIGAPKLYGNNLKADSLELGLDSVNKKFTVSYKILDNSSNKVLTSNTFEVKYMGD